MKRFLLCVGCLFLATVGLLMANDQLNLWLVLSSTGTSRYKMRRLFVESHPGEIPIIGSSRARHSYATSLLSTNAFNYGLNGSGQNETLVHLQAILAKGESSLCIVNLDPWGFCRKKVVGDYSLAKGPLPSSLELAEGEHLLDRIPGLRFYGCLRANLTEFIGEKYGIGAKRIDRGAVLSIVERSRAEWDYIIRTKAPKTYEVDPEVFQEYRRTLQSNNRVEIVFVLAPIPAEWWDSFAGKTALRDLCDQLATIPHVTVIDLCTVNLGAFDFSLFMDDQHCNAKGAVRFTQQLRAELRKQGLLADR